MLEQSKELYLLGKFSKDNPLPIAPDHCHNCLAHKELTSSIAHSKCFKCLAEKIVKSEEEQKFETSEPLRSYSNDDGYTGSGKHCTCCGK
jgi:hypothetical protein